MATIFLVEDDFTIAESIQNSFKQWQLDVHHIKNFSSIIEEFQQIQPKLVILDIQLPVFDGFYWCMEIRKISKVPILFLSSKDQPMDMIMAMKIGGDDFVQKPFHMEILVSKVQALLRRAYDYDEGKDLSQVQWNGTTIDFSSNTITLKEETIQLTKNEQAILKILVNHAEKIVTREEIIRHLWDDERFINDNTLTVNMNRLRNRLEELGLANCIQTKKGLGYMLTAEGERK